MNVHLESIGEVTVMAPEGRLDYASAQAFRQSVVAAVEKGARHIVLDLASVGFMDSSGLGAIIASLKTARQAGGDLRIARAREQVVTVLRLTALDQVLHPYSTLEEAYEQGSQSAG